jgi:hypothetical protein
MFDVKIRIIGTGYLQNKNKCRFVQKKLFEID